MFRGTHPETSSEDKGTREMWMPKGNRHLLRVSRMEPEVQSGSSMMRVSCLERFLTLTMREIHRNSTHAFL